MRINKENDKELVNNFIKFLAKYFEEFLIEYEKWELYRDIVENLFKINLTRYLYNNYPKTYITRIKFNLMNYKPGQKIDRSQIEKKLEKLNEYWQHRLSIIKDIVN